MKVAIYLLVVCAALVGRADAVELFNGRDLTGWYKYLRGFGRNNDPKNVITVTNGVIRITGEIWGCITTEQEYENYRLTVEYRWTGSRTKSKVGKALDSGILFHSVGADGAFGGTWMASHECNLVQGATGDFWTVHPKGSGMFLTAEVADGRLGDSSCIWQKGGREVTVSGNKRICRCDIDRNWKDSSDQPLAVNERPVGEWNVATLECRGDAVSAFFNGKLVNQALKVRPAKGRIQLQSEGCGIEFRRITLEPVTAEAGVRPKAMETLPLGTIRPEGWLRLQLEKQRGGLTGHAEELYGDIGESDWLTGRHQGGQYEWERGPYYAKGLVALALTLHDAGLTARAKRWIDAILASQREDGDFGPKRNNWWANMIALHFLRDWTVATGDERIVPFLERYFAYQRATLPEHPMIGDSAWAKCRTGDELEVLLWAYERTGKGELIDLARLIVSQSADWTAYYHDGGDSAWNDGYRVHIVNYQQGLKYPVQKWRLGGDDRDRNAYEAAYSENGWAMRMHGRVDRMVNGTEPLSGRETSQGTELCAIAERILSCQNVIEATGCLTAADDLEIVGYNSLPACLGDDGRGMRYYMILNQPRCTQKGKFGFLCNGAGSAMTPGPDAGFGCCRSNFHFAWPKFVQSMWMRKDGGLAAVAYGPCRVETDVATVAEGGGYPFGDTVTLTVEKTQTTAWPLAVRIPGWARGADVQVNGTSVNGVVSGRFCTIRRVWKPGDVVTLHLPAENEIVDGANGAISVRRGPLVYTLGLKAKITSVAGKGDARKEFPAREYRAAEAWNWALKRSAIASAKPRFAEKTEDPFLHGAVPAVMCVPARRTTYGGWGTMTYGFDLRVLEPPPSPVTRLLGDEGEVRLVPIGSTQIRMTVLPWFE